MDAFLKTASNSSVVANVQTILDKEEAQLASESKEELLQSLLTLIKYTKLSQAKVEGSAVSGQKRSADVMTGSAGVNVDGAVQSLQKIIPKQIKAQLTWKPSCKTGKAMWKYEGTCASAEVFKALMKCDIKFKRKKITEQELYTVLGCDRIDKSIRYDTLSLTGDVNVAWDADTCEFKFSGTYGK